MKALLLATAVVFSSPAIAVAMAVEEAQDAVELRKTLATAHCIHYDGGPKLSKAEIKAAVMATPRSVKNPTLI